MIARENGHSVTACYQSMNNLSTENLIAAKNRWRKQVGNDQNIHDFSLIHVIMIANLYLEDHADHGKHVGITTEYGAGSLAVE